MKRPASAACTFAVSALAAVALGALTLLGPPAVAETPTPSAVPAADASTPSASPSPTPPTPPAPPPVDPSDTPAPPPPPATEQPTHEAPKPSPSPSHAVVKPKPKPKPSPSAAPLPFQQGESVQLPAGSDKGPIGPPAQAAPNVGTLHAGLILSWTSWMLFAIGVLALAAGVAGLVVVRQRRKAAEG